MTAFRNFLRTAMAACAMMASLASGHAQDYPTQPIRLVIGLAAGGSSDGAARLLARELQARLKQPVVVDNRPGAGGNIASQYVAKAVPDGYTLLFTADNHNLNPLIYEHAGYDPSKDFTSVIQVSEMSLVLFASTDFPFRTINDVVLQARREPGMLAYGSSGIGLPIHIAMEKFARAAKLELTHVPYKGSALSVIDAAAGRIPLVMSSVSAARPFVQSGKLVPLVATGPSRSPSLPRVPTVGEAGYPAATSVAWTGIVAPAGTPANVVGRLNRELAEVLASKDVQESFLKLGVSASGGSVQAFNEFLARDAKAAQQIARSLNVKVN